jgi:hypothetical protein
MALRQEIEDKLRAGIDVVVDLEGVVTISPSFADELFGKLAAETDAGHLRFEHLSGHLASVAKTTAAARQTST